MYNWMSKNGFLLSDKRQTKNVNLKIDQCFERFCVRQTSDKRRKHDIKSFVGFAYYQQQNDINGPLCSFCVYVGSHLNVQFQPPSSAA